MMCVFVFLFSSPCVKLCFPKYMMMRPCSIRFRYGATGNTPVFRLHGHTSACRSCVFSDDGNALFSVSSDKTIQCIDMASGKAVAKLTNAHK